MTEFNFLKEYARMTKPGKNGCTINCETCPFIYVTGDNVCFDWMVAHPDEATEIVRKWSEEHPQKTRKSEFLKMFPNAKVDTEGIPLGCARYYDRTTPCEQGKKCHDCNKDFWNEVIDDE